MIVHHHCRGCTFSSSSIESKAYFLLLVWCWVIDFDLIRFGVLGSYLIVFDIVDFCVFYRWWFLPIGSFPQQPSPSIWFDFSEFISVSRDLFILLSKFAIIRQILSSVIAFCGFVTACDDFLRILFRTRFLYAKGANYFFSRLNRGFFLRGFDGLDRNRLRSSSGSSYAISRLGAFFIGYFSLLWTSSPPFLYLIPIIHCFVFADQFLDGILGCFFVLEHLSFNAIFFCDAHFVPHCFLNRAIVTTSYPIW